MHKSIVNSMSRMDTPSEFREWKKALHELADMGQIDCFLKKGPCFLRREQEAPQLRDEGYSTEVVVTIAGGYDPVSLEGLTQGREASVRDYAEGMTRDKLKARNLEVDFLVVDVPMTYNVIPGRPTLHKGISTMRNLQANKERCNKRKIKEYNVRLLPRRLGSPPRYPEV
ncbi:LOW QUALITY PROTEIN: hypothetical protein Cgig2_033581 [Carnegiea gigantea]|uniref:Uncharacterized protein n=1 Tax=Carnegiea gigantea TaxID=171969 RepID=A0A9Q1QLS3_9CARY|nr:LOW QUALITY PROTEIN: hypothetical protein Cgig2_033581 [Carnegiea gigantea]